MALHAPVALKPGDLMQFQFPTSMPSNVKAVVRNRTGECLGLDLCNFLRTLRQGIDRSAPVQFLRVAHQKYGNLCAIHATHRLSTQGYVESRKS